MIGAHQTKSRNFFQGLILVGGSALFFLTACERHESGEVDPGSKSEGSAPETDWPLFRGDAEMQGVSREVIAPPLSMAWSFEPEVAAGKKRPPIEATPVVANARVFVGSQDGRFYAIDLITGALIWSFKAEGPITAPGAVLGERVYFGDTYGFVYALEVASGREVWRFETEGKIEGGVNTLVSEAGVPQIYIGSQDFFLYCLNGDSGAVIWKHETGNYIVSTPSMIKLAGSTAIAFGGCDGILYVIPADGSGEKREIEIRSYIANTSTVRDGICYVAHNAGEIIAIDIASGETVWKIKTGVEYLASPAVDETLLYAAGPDKRLVAYDRVQGAEKWAFTAPRSLDSSPLVSGDIVWQGGMDGRLYAVNRNDGAEVWNFELGTQIKASPAASRGTLVICGEDGVVYGFRK